MKKILILIFTCMLTLSAQDKIDYDGKLRILTETDIDSISKNTSFEDLINKYGDPYGTTIPALTWPKQRDDISYTFDKEDIKWRNGYWFFFDLEDTSFSKKSKLLFVASFAQRQEYTGEAMIDLFWFMQVDWPKKHKGKRLDEVSKIKEF